VNACLNKSPLKRPSYAVLLRHPWLAPLMERPTGADSEDTDSADPEHAASSTQDEEVATWVKGSLERRLNGQVGDTKKPALHAVALDAVGGSPLLESPSTMTT
jgi:mitogen-activated protein kinase kinase